MNVEVIARNTIRHFANRFSRLDLIRYKRGPCPKEGLYPKEGPYPKEGLYPKEGPCPKEGSYPKGYYLIFLICLVKYSMIIYGWNIKNINVIAIDWNA